MANLKGTAVPNTGSVNGLYFNKNFEDLNIYEILNSLQFEGGADTFIWVYPVLSVDIGGTPTLIYSIVKWIPDTLTPSYYISFMGTEQSKAIAVINSEGITLTEYGKEIVDGTPSNGYIDNFNGLPISESVEIESTIYMSGNQNDKLSSLFSITPFEEVQEVNYETVEDLLMDVADAIREKKEVEGEYSRTTILNTELYDTIYFNNSLTADEVNEIFKDVPFVDMSSVAPDMFAPVYVLYAYYVNTNIGTQTIMLETMFVYSVNGAIESIWEMAINPQTFEVISANRVFDELLGWDLKTLKTGVKTVVDSGGSVTPLTEFMGLPIGSHNEQISTAISASKIYKPIKATNLAKEIRSIGDPDEHLIEIKFPLWGEGFEITNLGTFNNPDNVPIYKVEMSGIYVMGATTKYTGELTPLCSGPSFVGVGGIKKGEIYFSNNGAFYFVKLKDLIGKTIPYLSGVELTVKTTGASGAQVLRDRVDQIYSFGNVIVAHEIYTAPQTWSGDGTIKTLNDLQLKLPQELYIINRN